MTGFGVVTLNEDNKAKRIEIYFDPDGFLEVLRGKKECRDGIDRGVAVGEPIAGGLDALACMMLAAKLDDKNAGGGVRNGSASSESKSSEGEDGGGKPSGRCPFSGSTS